MTREELNSILEVIGATPEGEWLEFPDGHTATFQVAFEGVGLSVSRATALRQMGTQLHIRTERGDTCVIALAHVFACVIDGTGRETRRAGFSDR